MQMCYRGVKYNHNPVVLNLEQGRKKISQDVAQTQIIQTKFLGRVCHKKTIALTIADKKTRFLGQVYYPNFSSMTSEAAR